MKKLLFACCLLLAGAAGVFAQDSTSAPQPSTDYRTDETQTDHTQQDSDDPQAQDQTMSQPQDTTQNQGLSRDEDDSKNKVSISTAELPATVRASLESSDYSGWTVNNAYRKEKDGQTFYAVELKSGTETKMVKFDAQGNKVKEKEKDNAHEGHDQ